MQRLTVTHQVAAVLEELIMRPAKAEGLSVVEALLLSQLARLRGATCAELAWELVRDRGNTQRTLVALEQRQLVARSRMPGDPRDVSWGLTERGEATWGIVENKLVLQELAIERSVPELRACFDTLRRVVQQLGNHKAGWRSSWGEFSRPEVPTEDQKREAVEDSAH